MPSPLPSDPGSDVRGRTVMELFAGVGGFHLALDRAGFDVVWSNQWEPATKAQHAFDCYEHHVERRLPAFGRLASPHADLGLVEHVASNEDIAKVLDDVRGSCRIRRPFPVVPMSTSWSAGSRARTTRSRRRFDQAHGLVGKKGVLWWEIHRLLRLKLERATVRYLFLENVDRLLKSPTGQRGRDFAVMLASLADLGYEVEWRVVNAADYGFPQKRRRVFIVGRLGRRRAAVPTDQLRRRASWPARFPSRRPRAVRLGADFALDPDVKKVSDEFGLGARKTPFGNAGVMRVGRTARCWTSGRPMSSRPTTGPRQVARRRPRADGRRPRAVLRRRRRPREVAVPQGREEPDADQPSDAARVHLRRGSDSLPRLDRRAVADDPHRRGRRDARRGSST